MVALNNDLLLSFDTGGRDALDKVFLREEENKNTRYNGDNRHSQHLIPGYAGRIIKRHAEPQRNGEFFDAGNVD